MTRGIYKIGLLAKSQYIFMLISLVLITVVCAAFNLSTNDDFDLAKQEILLRKIGHDVLLNAGDSTSRVLPVKKVAENEYQIRFENEFTFKPHSLVSIIKKSLAKDKLVANYVVNVINCTNNDVIFGYVILKNEKSDIVPCSGRAQPKGCYLIELKFEKKQKILGNKGYLIGGIPLLAFVGLLITRSVKTRRKNFLINEIPSDLIKIGNTLFDPEKQCVTFEAKQTSLTTKENKLLFIFATSPNITVERVRLQKEIWEDEGVIVGRSLDVFISKLRKKLEKDTSVQLINIHGKGYKLQVNI